MEQIHAAFLSPVITPFDDAGHVDFSAMEQHLNRVLQGGVDGILIMGSIGEFYAISLDERIRLISFAKEVVAGRVRLLAGTSAMRYADVLRLTQAAYDTGVDGAVILPPYYFPLSDSSIETYYGSLAVRFPDLPIFLYNFPDRTGYPISAQVVAGLAARYPNIMGIKDTVSGMEHTEELIRTVKPIRPDFEIYSGFDNFFLQNVRAGGSGCIAGMSNLVPGLCGRMASSLRQGYDEEAWACMEQLQRIMDVYWVGVPFVPYIKKAVNLLHPEIPAAPAFPLLEATEAETQTLRDILQRIQL